MSNEKNAVPDVEVLAPLSEAESREMVPLKILTPLEEVFAEFDAIAAVTERFLEWADKIQVVDAATRDQAMSEARSLVRTAKLLEDKRLFKQEPIKQFITDFKAYVDAKRAPILAKVKVYDEKVVAYGLECKRREDEEKATLLAEKRKEQDKIEAQQREREMKEQELRQQEEERLEKIEAETRAKANAAGQIETDQMHADFAREEERARIDQARADREREERDRKIEEDRRASEAQQRMATGIAQTKGANRVKGLKTVWAFELVDESQLPRQFLTYDEKKVRSYLNAGLADQEKDELKRVPGMRCWEAVQAQRGGR